MTPRLAPQSGTAESLGPTITADGVNFAVHTEAAQQLTLCLFDEKGRETERFPFDGRTGDVHHCFIAGLGAGARYGLRADGVYDPGQGLWFDPQKLLVDPYAKRVDRTFALHPDLALPRSAGVDTAPHVPKAIVTAPGRKVPSAGRADPGLIYELNPRGYTMAHHGVPQPLRGTLAGLTAPKVIEHLLRIGVDTVELMPVCAWIDDLHLPRLGLTNAWGYNPVNYFAPDPRLAPGGLADLRELTQTYRAHGISVVLDVVYNHTGKSDATGPVLSFKGLDPHTYYRFADDNGGKRLVNDAGTGNTLRCDHPVVQNLVLDSLRYWVEEAGIAGFRFDLAPILGRAPGFDPHARMIELIKADPVLRQSLLIAEPWDPGPGGYQLGAFGAPFLEWNDTYRDDVRRFWRGDDFTLGALATRVSGSAPVFAPSGRLPAHGVNFLAVHDGFTLADLVSYSGKHNQANGENNRDGHSENSSWNCGTEGNTADPAILDARKRDIKALLATLFVSRGTPLLQQGDEMGRTQEGNNNAYAQDNAITWLDWRAADLDLIGFTASLSALRKAHPAFGANRFLSGQGDVSWLHPDGRVMADGDWNIPTASVLGMHLRMDGDEVLVWFNRRREPVPAHLPHGDWHVALSSAGSAKLGEASVVLPERSLTVLTPAP